MSFDPTADAQHVHHDVEHDGVGNVNGHAERIEWFNYAEIDGELDALASAPQDAKAHACELVRKIIAGLIGDELTIVDLRGAVAKFALFAAAIAPDKVPFNQIQLAALFGVTKQNFCKHARDLQTRLGVQVLTPVAAIQHDWQ
ncbi:MAG: hypothetical protein QM813_10880 [Verrucomicrobiota bacterium]